jgi:tRNA G18 (ribose-2'-O)-methylase SpoU
VAEALARGTPPLRLLLVAEAPADPRVAVVVRAAQAAGVAVQRASAAALWRLSQVDPPAELLALAGPDPGAPRDEVLAAGGALWLLAGTAYPGNAGFAIRTAEVSGADGIFVDCAFGHEGRREALRAAMRADRFLPVFWEPALPLVADARAAGRTVLAVEDVGSRAPWEVDLRGALLLVVGGERHGVPAEVLAACDGALRIPMRGFIPSYNLQAAMAAVAAERLRQLGAGDAGSRSTPDARYSRICSAR